MQNFDDDALRGVGLGAGARQALARHDWPPGQRPARVTEVQRAQVLLDDGAGERAAVVAGALVKRLADAGDALAVGDWVAVRDDGTGGLVVADRVPPWAQIARRTNDGCGGLRRQVLVANVDTALLVMGLDHDYNLRRLERYLALVRSAGVAAVLVLTKADLVDASSRERRLAEAIELLPPDMPVMALDARQPGVGLWLAPWLGAGQTLVLLGSSGAGKSTLTNTLLGVTTPTQATGTVRKGDGRGRHTTTARTLHRLAGGACIIDTPGLRALRLDAGDGDALVAAFGDIARLTPRCRFRNCRHRDEPGCAVREGVSAERLANFHKLEREARRDAMTVLERRAQLAAWKARARASRARGRDALARGRDALARDQ